MKKPLLSTGYEYGVKHFYAEKEDILIKRISDELNTNEETAYFLIGLGCAYVNGIRITNPEHKLNSDDYLRIHTKPRRYAIDDLERKNLIFYEDKDLIIANKPSELPCIPTVDNCKENLLTHLESIYRSKIYVTHRIDISTSGLVVYAKNSEAQTQFNKLIMKNKITKNYRLLCHSSFNTDGKIKHWMKPSPKAPKEVSTTEIESWLMCELEVLGYKPAGNFCQVEVNLLTGRTHQIRAQFSNLGFPLIGDILYNGETRTNPKGIALEAMALSFPWYDSARNFYLPVTDRFKSYFEL